MNGIVKASLKIYSFVSWLLPFPSKITCLKSKAMHQPLIVVLGATGAGKSKLALEVGRCINGEIINADAMQMYQGLDIVTNKVTEEDMKLCQHHMIGFLSPLEQFTIVDFQSRVLKLIDEIQSRHKVPILVGGTNYYIESILWESLIAAKTTADDNIVTERVDDIRQELEEMSSTALHERLAKVDPQMASTTHPKDRRKIIRGLEVRRAEFHPIRIDRRVDRMVDDGLLKELADFHQNYNANRLLNNLKPDYEHGIFQSIGFKEFHEYLTAIDATESQKEKLLDQGIKRMKLSTWQYAKSQEKWIRKRIVNRETTVPVYPVDGSDPSRWKDTATFPTFKLLRTFYSTHDSIASKLKDINCEDHALPEPVEKKVKTQADDYRTLKRCDVCGGKLIVSSSWEDHVKSKSHKKMFGLLRKKQAETVALLSAREKQLTEVAATRANELSQEKDIKLFEDPTS